MSQRIGADLHEFDYDTTRIRRYFKCAWKTVRIFHSRKYDVIFVQNPSLILANIAVFLGRLYSTTVIVDAHNVAVIPDDDSSSTINWLTRKALCNAFLTIVSNKNLVAVVEEAGGRGFPLPDPLPDLNRRQEKFNLSRTFNVLFICTWSIDEPCSEVLEAAHRLGNEYHIYITGRVPADAVINAPENVTLTGFVPENDFFSLLRSVDVALDLTTRSDCLVCGAYEAIALETPVILSTSDVNTEVFGAVALLTENSPDGIKNSIETIKEEHEKWVKRTINFRAAYEDTWNSKKNQLLEMLTELD